MEARRRAFRRKSPAANFSRIRIEGLSHTQTRYCENVLFKDDGVISAEDLKSRYFRLYYDHNVNGLFPRATYDKARGSYDLDVLVKREKPLEVRFGGMFSSRPVNTGMLGLRYNFFGRTSSRLEGTGVFRQVLHGRPVETARGPLHTPSDVFGTSAHPA